MAVIRQTFTCLNLQCFNISNKPWSDHISVMESQHGFLKKMKDIEAVEKVQKRAT